MYAMFLKVEAAMDFTPSGPPASDTSASELSGAELPAGSPTVYGIYHGFLTQVADHVMSTGMGDKRCMYGAMRRDPPASPDTFLPKFGLTVGEIASLLVL
jgi:hypothetical protein